MSSMNLSIRRAVRYTLIAGAIASASSLSVRAQDVPTDGADEVGEVVIVTGSRIRRTDAETASPVQVVSREEM